MCEQLLPFPVFVQKKRRRVWSECEECGRRFSRMSLLKAHRQTHVAENAAAADTPSPSSPPSSNTLALRCSQCGKRFSSATRLHSHVRTQHLEDGVGQLTWPGSRHWFRLTGSSEVVNIAPRRMEFELRAESVKNGTQTGGGATPHTNLLLFWNQTRSWLPVSAATLASDSAVKTC